MSGVARDAPPTQPPPGLCPGCRHHRLVVNRRGSRFYLCERSRDDDRFPRYPPVPVLRCVGFEPAEPDPFEEAFGDDETPS